MSKIALRFHPGPLLFALSVLPLSASAAIVFSSVFTVLQTFIDFFNNLVPALISLAVLVFLWGLVKFIAHADDEKALEEGKHIMVWGMVGLFVIVSLWGIVGFLQESFGLDSNSLLIIGSAPSIPTTVPSGI